MTSFGARLLALGLSTAAHAVLLAPAGRSPVPAPGAASDAAPVIDVVADLAPEPTITPAADRPTISPEHTHPSPVSLSHARMLHDASLANRVAPSPPALDRPGHAAPVATTSDDTARFAIVVGTATSDAYATASPAGTAPSHDDQGAAVQDQSVDAPARLVRGLAPSYPERARADGIEGVVGLELVVGTSGVVESARIVHAVGHGLDEAALSAVRQFRFTCATKGGRAVRVRMPWPVQFLLN
jgi:periplasmic protein TonB